MLLTTTVLCALLYLYTILIIRLYLFFLIGKSKILDISYVNHWDVMRKEISSQ